MFELIELLLNSASDDDEDENLMSLSMEKEANNNNNNNSSSTGALNTNGLTLASPRPTTPMTGLAPPLLDIKSQRPSTPSTTIDDKDPNDSEGNEFIPKMTFSNQLNSFIQIQTNNIRLDSSTQ